MTSSTRIHEKRWLKTGLKNSILPSVQKERASKIVEKQIT